MGVFPLLYSGITASAILKEAPVPSGDPYWANVVLMCGFEGADGSSTMTDESSFAHVLTAISQAVIDTAQSRFGVSSLFLNGSSDRVTALDSADWRLSAANSDAFTIEGWIRAAGLSGTQVIVNQWNTSSQRSWQLVAVGTTILRFQFSTNGSATVVAVDTSGVTLANSQWYHVAVDKDATGKIRIYIDGVMRGSATPADSSFHDSTSVMEIGSQGTAFEFFGWIDELRITKGVARYASDAGFSVPTQAYPRSA